MPDVSSELVRTLRGASSVVVLSGAGVSAESGVPTFRDAQTGLWARYDPAQLATPEAFRHDPELVWSWYAWRRELVRAARPNPAHFALAELERRVPDFTLVTQNVDGLHRRAGSRNVVELHGDLFENLCSREGKAVEKEGSGVPPRCPDCGAYLRPGVVWFGEALSPEAVEQAQEAAQSCDVFLSVGTSGVVYPAAALPGEALAAGAAVVEINPDETPLSPQASFVLRGPAGERLPELVEAAWPAGRLG